MHSTRLYLALALLVPLACGDGQTPAGVIIEIESDPTVPEQLARIKLFVDAPGGFSEQNSTFALEDVDADRELELVHDHPVTGSVPLFRLLPGGRTPGPLVLACSGFDAGNNLVMRGGPVDTDLAGGVTDRHVELPLHGIEADRCVCQEPVTICDEIQYRCVRQTDCRIYAGQCDPAQQTCDDQTGDCVPINCVEQGCAPDRLCNRISGVCEVPSACDPQQPCGWPFFCRAGTCAAYSAQCWTTCTGLGRCDQDPTASTACTICLQECMGL